MKKLVLLLTLFSAVSASAETEMACWNVYSKKGSAPIMRARIVRNDVLTQVTFNAQDEYFSSYNSTFNDGLVHKSQMSGPTGNVQGQVITTNRSPYQGDNVFNVLIGNYSVTGTNVNNSGSYLARLVLPRDLSNRTLQTYHIRNAQERSNAVAIIPPAVTTDQAGENYLRMFCVSR